VTAYVRRKVESRLIKTVSSTGHVESCVKP